MRYYHVGLNLTNKTVSWKNQIIKPQNQSNLIPLTEDRFKEMSDRRVFNNITPKIGCDKEMIIIGVEYITNNDI